MQQFSKHTISFHFSMTFVFSVDNKYYVKALNFLLFFVFLCSVGVHTVSELRKMQERMESSQLKTYDLTQSDLVKDHLRYLVNWPNEIPS